MFMRRGVWLASLFACGCATFAAEQTIGVAKQALPALESEGDYDFAESAAAGNLKFLEGLSLVVPNNADLLELLCRGYASYAFAFLEERASEARAKGDEVRADALVERAINLYERAGRYGLRLLGLKRGFDDAFKKGGPALREKLVEFQLRAEVGSLFWTAYAWLGAVNLGPDRVENLALAPKALELARRALALDEGYFFGGPHLVLGGYEASIPNALGGKPERARKHFDRAVELSGGKSLLAKVMLAERYAVKAKDKALFLRLLKEIAAASLEDLPTARLPNALAKRKAARLQKRVGELFP